MLRYLTFLPNKVPHIVRLGVQGLLVTLLLLSSGCSSNDTLFTVGRNILSRNASESVVMNYTIRSTTQVSIYIHNAAHKRIKSILNNVSRSPQSTPYTESWNLTDDNNLRVSAGLYYAVLSTPEITVARKIYIQQ